MRRLGAKALAWSALAMATAGTAGGTGCAAKKATELVPGVSTQMVVTKDLNEIRITLERNGAIEFCEPYPIDSTGIVELPSTLGVLPETSPNSIVTVTIRGYDVAGSAGTDLGACLETGGAPVAQPTAANAATGNPRVIRRSIQSYVNGRILLLPMPLSYSCQDVDCSMMGPQFACKGGQCVDSTILDSSTLADFDPALLDGTGLCFSPMECFATGDVVPAELIDADKCIYGFPGWDTTLAGTGANVRIYYKDITWQPNPAGGWEQVLAEAGEEEVLDEDPMEGFTVVPAAEVHPPDAGQTISGLDAGPTFNSKGPFIQLAQGLCDLAKAATTPPPHPATGSTPLTYHTISDVQIASLCPPKVQLLPICAAERNNSARLPDGGTTTGTCNVAIPMDPAPSAMYLVMDQSVYMHGAYGAAGSAQALALSLTDPVFKQTYAGFKFLNDLTETDCGPGATTSYATPTLPACAGGMTCTFGLAGDLQPQIANALSGWAPSETGSGTCTGMGTGLGTCTANQYCYMGQCYNPFPLDLEGAMRPSGAYAQVQSFLTQSQITAPNIAGVMFIVNRAPVAGPATPPEAADCAATPPDVTVSASIAPGDCGGVSGAACTAQTVIESEALSAFTTSGIRTYFVVLDNDDSSSPNGMEPIQYFNQVATDVPQAVTTLDATMLNSAAGGGGLSSGAMGDVASFLQSITQLGTCLYQLPPDVVSGTPAANVEVSFSLPGAPPGAGLTIVSPVPGCTAATEAGPPDGWSYDGKDRVRLCGQPCATLRQYVIGAAATQAAVPVTIANLCSGSKSVPTSGADSGSMVTTGSDASQPAADASVTPCDPTTCPLGCCDLGNTCQPGDQDNACGSGGNMCLNCGVGTCAAGACSGGAADSGGSG